MMRATANASAVTEMNRVCTEDLKAERAVKRPVRVFMMDLLSIVPYYTGHLTAALKGDRDVQVNLGAITYYLDRDFFRSRDLQRDATLVDVVSQFDLKVPILRRILKTLEYFVNLIALLIRVFFSRPDVLHIQFLPMLNFGVPAELWFVRAVRKMGIKIVHTVHNVLPQDTGELCKERYAAMYRIADRLICHDLTAQRSLMDGFSVPAGRISVIPHGPLFQQPHLRPAKQCRKELNLPETSCLVLCQGILRPYKGVDFLLRAWRRVHAERTNACLAIVGTGSEEMLAAIREQVSSLGIESSTNLQLRFVSERELALFHQAADVLVYPYSEITTSGALMTGVGYGKAIVVSRLPAFEQMLRDEETALLVSYGDEEALARQLVRLANDPALGRKLGRQLLESCSGESWRTIAERTVACYRTALCDAIQAKETR